MPFAPRTDDVYAGFLKSLDSLPGMPPTHDTVDAVVTALGRALLARPLDRADLARRALDAAWARFAPGIASPDSPLMCLHERCRERCDRHDHLVETHTCPKCLSPSPVIYQVRRPLDTDECRICTDCRDKALEAGMFILTDESPVLGDCNDCSNRRILLHCVGRRARPLIERVCGACAEALTKNAWRPIVVSTMSL